MAARRSAGLLIYRRHRGVLEVFLVHPGGPLWRNKDEGAWSVPKGEYDDDEDPLAAAQREFREETGMSVAGTFIALAPVRQAGGKVVQAWALAADFDAADLCSTTFEMEWPPRSGRRQAFPEVDRGGWFDLDEAGCKILAGQRPLLDELARAVAGSAADGTAR
ncbi:MAG: NUDIX domain-containing protein [Casimicrobiaceae bacterium]